MNIRVKGPVGRPRAVHLTEKQIEARDFLSKQRCSLLVGGSRSGKTMLVCRSIAVRAMRSSGSRHLITRFRFNATRSSIWLDTWPKMMRLWFPDVVTKDNNRDGYIQFSNGAEVWMGGLDDKERVEKILGLEFATIFFNEASQIPYDSYLTAKTRLAQMSLIDGKKDEYLVQREYVDLNPGGTSHWTNRMFVEHLDPHERKAIPDPDNYAWMSIPVSSNAENLSPEYIRGLKNLPERQRKRFWDGIYMPEVEGALWTWETLAASRWDGQAGDNAPDRIEILQRSLALPAFVRAVVAIDPSGTRGEQDERSDAVGIVVVARGVDGKAYVIADLTCRLPPEGWARVAVTAYHNYRCDKIVAERNYGGAMVENTIKMADANVPYGEVVASRGKAIRAEPVSFLYAQKKVIHMGIFPDLEDQYMNFSTNGYVGDRSPDNADAAIWALTELMVEGPTPIDVSPEFLAATRLGFARRRR